MVLDTLLILILVGTEDMVGSRYHLLAIRHYIIRGTSVSYKLGESCGNCE